MTLVNKLQVELVHLRKVFSPYTICYLIIPVSWCLLVVNYLLDGVVRMMRHACALAPDESLIFYQNFCNANWIQISGSRCWSSVHPRFLQFVWYMVIEKLVFPIQSFQLDTSFVSDAVHAAALLTLSKKKKRKTWPHAQSWMSCSVYQRLISDGAMQSSRNLLRAAPLVANRSRQAGTRTIDATARVRICLAHDMLCTHRRLLYLR